MQLNIHSGDYIFEIIDEGDGPQVTIYNKKTRDFVGMPLHTAIENILFCKQTIGKDDER